MVIINKRSVEKANTRKRILEATEFLVRRKGFVKISSNEIAKECDVSQGSIFLHFGTKHGLLTAILDSNIDLIESNISELWDVNSSQDLFLRSVLDSLVTFEDILSRIYKDYSYLDTDTKKNVDSLEILMKNNIYENLKINSSKNMSIIDSFISIDAFLSQIKDYLISKETFTISNSVIRQKRGRISKLYKMLFY